MEPTEQVRRVIATFDALAESYDQGGIAYSRPVRLTAGRRAAHA